MTARNLAKIEHVVYITEKHAWCSACKWEFRDPSPVAVEEATDWHVDLTRGCVKPGWGVDKAAERARVAAAEGGSDGRIKTGRQGASTPSAALTPSSNRPNDGSEVLTP